ncbi:hypothetical protein LX32DRAFT_223744 [Colletotrichum zoysiae]|uniref:Uncharacterized protein n=1 Tax=Colletotrichum zoysiae TaxID=1216348 RepID=A0AAD9H4V4_9PEZI|nr:hypothetical protein LX32DRAFT_223744 [Colletotrichum zoysiae]
MYARPLLQILAGNLRLAVSPLASYHFMIVVETCDRAWQKQQQQQRRRQQQPPLPTSIASRLASNSHRPWTLPCVNSTHP